MTDATRQELGKLKLILQGDGVSIERDVPENVAAQVIQIVMGGEAPVQHLQAVAGGGTGRPRRSLREYMNEVGAKRNPEKILAIGQFLAQGGLELFTRKDVKSQFKKASEPIPKNHSRDFALALGSGWVADDGGKFYVTATGRQALEQKFSGHVRKEIRRGGSSTRTRKSKKGK